MRIVKQIKVVNDLAERGVALITEFNRLITNDEEENTTVDELPEDIDVDDNILILFSQ